MLIVKIRADARRELREERRDRREAGVENELLLKRLEELRTEAVRDTVRELLEYPQQMKVESDEVATRAADLATRVAELAAALERVRCTSKAGLLEQVDLVRY